MAKHTISPLSRLRGKATSPSQSQAAVNKEMHRARLACWIVLPRSYLLIVCCPPKHAALHVVLYVWSLGRLETSINIMVIVVRSVLVFS